MADTNSAGGLEHSHVGSVQTQLIVTFIGGVIVLNAYIADYFLFEKSAIADISALIGALILATPIILGAIREVRRGRMHMTVLVAVAVIAAFALGSTGEAAAGEAAEAGGYKVAGIVAFFMMLATLIERQTAAGARESVEKLMTLTPPTAELVGGETVPVAELNTGDHVRIRPGDRVPADGRIVDGESTINEATITGESVPADKLEGDEVFAGTHNLTGSIEVEVTRTGEDTTLGKVKKLILEAEKTKTPFMQLIDRYAAWYTPLVLMIAFVVYMFTGQYERSVSVLVIACPCAFVLATPTAMVAGLSAAARLGILIKNVGHLEAAGDITAVVFDKTGTLTTGALTVTRMSPLEDVDGAELLEAAASVEQHSRHPVAQAVARVAERANLPLKNVRNFKETPGKGVVGTLGDSRVIIGRASFLEDQGLDLSDIRGEKHEAATGAMSMLYVAKDGRCIGWLGLEDKTRPEAQQSTAELRELGVKRLSMLTGDRWSVAKKVAGELGCTDVQGECLPEQKLRLVEMLRDEGHTVAVVGDGVNDAPALAAGDLGIAMGAAGSDVAINSASIALMTEDLSRLPFLVRLSRRLRTVIVQNLIFAAVFVVVGLVLAGLGFLEPVIAAVLHNVGSFIVIFNSARLVRFGENLAPYSGRAVDTAKPVPVATA